MKRFLVVLLALLLTFSLMGCGAKEKLEKKAGEALTEKIIEEMGGGDVDVDDGQVTFKGDDGESVTFGGTQWPTSELAKKIPKFEGGTIVSVMESKEGIMIGLEDVDKDDFDKYYESIKKDFPEEGYEYLTANDVTYGGKDSQGLGIQLYYIERTLSIILVQES